MREILGRRLQRLRNRLKSLRPAPGQSGDQALLDAALTCATAWQWPVLPGVGRSGADSTRCACPDPDCVVPGAHPFDPGLLAATTDPRMVAWWWTNRPTAPVLMATGGSAPCAVSLPPPRPRGPSYGWTRRGCGWARSWPPPPGGRSWSRRTRWSGSANSCTPRTTCPPRCASTARAATCCSRPPRVRRRAGAVGARARGCRGPVAAGDRGARGRAGRGEQRGLRRRQPARVLIPRGGRTARARVLVPTRRAPADHSYGCQCDEFPRELGAGISAPHSRIAMFAE